MNFNRLFTTKDWQKLQNSFSGCFHLLFGILMQGSGKQEDSGCYNVLEMFWSMKREKQLSKSSCKGPACAILGYSLLLGPAANVLNHHSWLLFNFEHILYPHSFHLVLPVSFPLHPQNTVWQFLYFWSLIFPKCHRFGFQICLYELVIFFVMTNFLGVGRTDSLSCFNMMKSVTWRSSVTLSCLHTWW